MHGKRSLWQHLESVADLDPGLDDFDFKPLIARAESQLERLEELKVDAAELALTGSDDLDAAPRRTAARTG